MKKLQKKWICLMLLGMMLCYVHPNTAQAKESMVSLMYVQNNRCLTDLRFSGTTANCTLTVSGKKDTSSISGTLKLYDITSKKTVSSWSISTVTRTRGVHRDRKTGDVVKTFKPWHKGSYLWDIAVRPYGGGSYNTTHVTYKKTINRKSGFSYTVYCSGSIVPTQTGSVYVSLKTK